MGWNSGRIAGDAVVIEVDLILRDQVGGSDGVSVRVDAELREKGIGVAQVDDLCGKPSALVTKGNDGRHSLLFI